MAAIRRASTFYHSTTSGAQDLGVNIDEVIKNNHYGKQSTDYEFYSQLMALFCYRGQAVEFMKRHRFNDHTIVVQTPTVTQPLLPGNT